MTKQAERDAITKNWAYLLDAATHKITTRILTLKFSLHEAQENLSQAVAGYELALNNNLINDPLREDKLQKLKTLPQRITQYVDRIEQFINGLHPIYIKLMPDEKLTVPYSVAHCLQHFLENFPFTQDDERQLVTLTIDKSFAIGREAFFVTQLLSRLLEYFIEARQKDKDDTAKISSTQDEQANMITFEATLTNDPASLITTVEVDDFFKMVKNTVVPGIAFCKLGIEQLGGTVIHSITVDKNGLEKMHFLIKLPGGGTPD